MLSIVENERWEQVARVVGVWLLSALQQHNEDRGGAAAWRQGSSGGGESGGGALRPENTFGTGDFLAHELESLLLLPLLHCILFHLARPRDERKTSHTPLIMALQSLLKIQMDSTELSSCTH